MNQYTEEHGKEMEEHGKGTEEHGNNTERHGSGTESHESAEENLEKENKPVEQVQPEVVGEAKAEVENEGEVKAEEVKAPEAQPEVVEEPKAEEPKVDEPEPPAEVVEEPVEAAPMAERKWYVIQAMTGQEDRVKQSIELTIAQENLKEKVFQVLLPTEEIVEIKGGKRVEKVKKMFPGYVFLEMILDEETWYQIRQTPGVARFIGSKTQPTPVSGREMQRVLKQLGKEERLEITFEKGEAVRVISGPFRGYTGTVDEVNEEKGKLKVLINIFGRDTPVEVNFEHAQKLV